MNSKIKDEVINKAILFCGNYEDAVKWYQSANIPSFGYTPKKLVSLGKGEAVLMYLERVSDGGYA